jgi:uncharacterized protein DUF3617
MKNPKTLLSLALFPLLAVAANDHINIKPGLWEVTTTTDTSGVPGLTPEQKAQMDAARAKMPPEMRAKMEAARKQQGAPHVSRSCVTKEDLDKPMSFDAGKADDKCTRSLVKSTSTVQEVHVDCTLGARKSSGTFHIEAPTPTAWTGTMDTTVSGSGSDIKLHTNVSGKWLGAACGDVKPHSEKK